MIGRSAYLERHGNQWRVTVAVPRKLRALLGKAHLKHSLGTSDLRTANLLKHAHVARLKKIVEDAMLSVAPSDILNEARLLRATRGVTSPVFHFDEEVADEIIDDPIGYYAEERATVLERSLGYDKAKEFYDTVMLKVTPLDEHLEAFIEDHDYQPKSVLELRRVVRWLGEWLKANGKPQTIQGIDQVVAAGFMRELVQHRRLDHKNAGKYISFLRSYWRWMEEHGIVSTQSATWSMRLPKPKTHARHALLEADSGKRPFTDNEIRVLLGGEPNSASLADLIRIAALSGMRIEEIYRLRIRDCGSGSFAVLTGKRKMLSAGSPYTPSLARLFNDCLKGNS